MKLQFAVGELETYVAFLDEARDHLDSMEEKILDLTESCEPEKVNVIFRGLHSIKGVASFLNLSDIQKLSHQLESVFDAVRQGKLLVTEDMIHTSLVGLDHLTEMVKSLEIALEAKVQLPGRQIEISIFDVDYLGEYRIMQSLLHPEEVVGPIQPDPIQLAQDTSSPVSDEEFITAEMRITFAREAEELLDGLEQTLLEIESHPENSELLQLAFRSVHSYKGNCGFFGFADSEKVAHAFEEIMEKVRNGGQAHRVPSICAFGLKCLDVFRKLQASNGSPQPMNREIINACLMEAGHLMREFAPAKTAQVNLRESSARNPAAESKAESKAETKRDLRVDLAKLDHLLDLVGELVIASGMVVNHPKLKDANITDLDKVFHQLQGVVTDLQQMALGVRMVNIEGVFKKMTRLVHDVAGKCGKQVKLELSGEKTEIDKNLVDLLADPLVHMIRNSIDHGIEKPEERLLAGKESTGVIWLSAEQIGGEVIVSIRDNGRGMNREKILSKALEKGLCDASARDFPDDEIFKFIFLPGFSTAEAVTSTSGRGVGMDVVKSNVERMNGRIDIKSTQGQGTTISLRIPLTLSIIEGMEVRVGNSLFVLPMLAVHESIAPLASQVTRVMRGSEVLLLRGHTYPVVRLHELHQIAGAGQYIEKSVLVRLESQGHSYCLMVDEIVGQRQTVVKALPKFLGDIQGVTACSILDDGAISLILDPNGLWKKHLGQGDVTEPGDADSEQWNEKYAV